MANKLLSKGLQQQPVITFSCFQEMSPATRVYFFRKERFHEPQQLARSSVVALFFLKSTLECLSIIGARIA